MELVPNFFFVTFRCRKGGCKNVYEGGGERFKRSLHLHHSLLEEMNCFRRANLHPHFCYAASKCVLTNPYKSILLFFISFTRPSLLFSVPRPIGCTETLLQCLEEMRSRTRSALPRRRNDFRQPGQKHESISALKQEDRTFQALTGLQISGDVVF